MFYACAGRSPFNRIMRGHSITYELFHLLQALIFHIEADIVNDILQRNHKISNFESNPLPFLQQSWPQHLRFG